VAASPLSIGGQFRITGDALRDASPTSAENPAVARRRAAKPIDSDQRDMGRAPPNMTAGNGPDAVNFPKIPK